MDFSFNAILPAILGFFSGMIAPIIVEKWKGKKEEERKVMSTENEMIILQNSFKSLAADLEKRLSVTEERLRSLIFQDQRKPLLILLFELHQVEEVDNLQFF